MVEGIKPAGDGAAPRGSVSETAQPHGWFRYVPGTEQAANDSLAAMIAAADAEIARARADQQAASDRLAKEEAVLVRSTTGLTLRAKPKEWLAVKTADSSAQRRRTSQSSQPEDTELLAAKKLLPEVVAHDDFVARTGATGGWHPQDAADFDKAVTAARGNHTHAIRICCDMLSGVTEEDIRAHACWHREMQELAVGKRAALQRWKAAKKAEADAAKAAGFDQEALEEAERRRVAEQKQRQRRRTTKEALQQWKAEKAEAEAAAAAEEAAEREGKERQERERRAAEQRRRRESLEPYLAEKEAQAAAEAEAAAAEAAQKPPKDPHAAARVRLRQQEAHARQQWALEAAAADIAMQKERKQRLLQEASPQVLEKPIRRDPARLAQPTKSLAHRLEARRSTGSQPRDSGYIRHVSGPRRTLN